MRQRFLKFLDKYFRSRKPARQIAHVKHFEGCWHSARIIIQTRLIGHDIR